MSVYHSGFHSISCHHECAWNVCSPHASRNCMLIRILADLSVNYYTMFWFLRVKKTGLGKYELWTRLHDRNRVSAVLCFMQTTQNSPVMNTLFDVQDVTCGNHVRQNQTTCFEQDALRQVWTHIQNDDDHLDDHHQACQQHTYCFARQSLSVAQATAHIVCKAECSCASRELSASWHRQCLEFAQGF